MPKICPICGTNYPDTNVFCLTDGSTLHAAGVSEDLIGSVVADRYLVTDLLGEGGMGRVYLARHVRLPQQAAIKVLRSDMVRDPASVARFNREASNASRIDDEHVARVFDFGETSDGTVYLAMEYVPGRTLKTILAETGPLTPARTVSVVRQIGDGLDAAHRLGIVHRDLKPDNVIVAEGPDGEDRIKVVDFGIAKALGTDESGPGLTKTGYVVGTPDFMSPEQLMGGAIDARSDVYALALLAFQCLTGVLPFDVTTPNGVTARLIEPPRRLFDSMPAVPWPAGVQGVFDAALARDPAQRPDSAGGFARTLALRVEEWQRAEAGPDASAASPSTATTPAASATSAVGARSAPPPAVAASAPAGASTASGGSSRVLLYSVVGVVAAGLLAYGVTTMRARGSASSPAPTASAVPSAPVPASDTTSSLASGVSGSAPVGASTAPSPTSGASSPASTPSRTAPAGAPTRARGSAADGLAARHTLDSITTALDPVSATEGGARAAIGALGALMPRLATPVDSVWASVRLAEANLLLDRPQQACTALRVARALATSSAQREVVRKYDTQLQCGG